MGRVSLVGIFCVFLLACGDDGAMPGVDAGGTGDAGGEVDSGGPGVDTGTPPPPTDGGTNARTLTLSITATGVPPGQERTMCVVKRLPADVDVHALAVHTRINQGSHHMIVYRVADTEERTDPFACQPFTDLLGGGAPIAMAQSSEATIDYPDGTGLRLNAGQMIRLELHYINVTAGPLDITGEVDFDVVDAAGEIDEIDFIFSGPLSIVIPPHSNGNASRFFRVPGSDASPIHVFTVSSHTHQWGTEATVHRAASASDAGEMVHVSHDWEEPPIDVFDPPLTFTGGDGLMLNCDYFNGSDSTVTFGDGFNDEMCFLVSMYYPSRGFILDL